LLGDAKPDLISKTLNIYLCTRSYVFWELGQSSETKHKDL